LKNLTISIKLIFFLISYTIAIGGIDLPPSASEESESDDNDIGKLKNDECSGHQ
jgi:hypothetical protein